MARDYYEVLSVSRTCTEVELKAAFRKKAIEHHPDKNPGDPQAEARFKECNEAYSVLSDASKRSMYDRFGHAGVNGGGGGGGGRQGFQDAGDIFSEVFGQAFGEMFNQGRRSSGPARGQDLRYDTEVTLEQAFAGDEIEVRFPTVQTCEVCDGSGRQARHPAHQLPDLRRRRPGAGPAGLLCGGADLSALRRPWPGGLGPLPRLSRRGPGAQGPHPVGPRARRRR